MFTHFTHTCLTTSRATALAIASGYDMIIDLYKFLVSNHSIEKWAPILHYLEEPSCTQPNS